MPAFWVRPKRSPEGQCRSISSVSGKVPGGPSALVFTSFQSRSEDLEKLARGLEIGMRCRAS